MLICVFHNCLKAWTDGKPRVGQSDKIGDNVRPASIDQEEAKRMAVKECLKIVQENAPDKVDEIANVLKKFRGREFQILKRLKQQYL